MNDAEEAQERFEGMQVDGNEFTLTKSPVIGIGKVKYGGRVRIEGIVEVANVSFGRDKESGAFQRIHTLKVMNPGDLVVTGILTDEDLFRIS